MEPQQQSSPHLPHQLEHPITFVRWLVFAAIIGVTAGTISSAFYYALTWAANTRAAHPWLLWLLPAGGVAIVLIYRAFQVVQDRGTNLVLTSVREDSALPLRMAPLIFLTTVITHLLGGSAGREGAVLQIGGSISAAIGRLMRLDGKDRRVITMCGMAAAFSALFGAPMTAAVFAMEVVSVGVMYYAAIVPCVVSALIGLSVAQQFGLPGASLTLTEIPAVTPLTLIQVLGMGILFALLSILFCKLMHGASHLYSRAFPNPFVRAAAGGVLVIALTCLVWLWDPGSFDYNGAGEAVLHAAITGHARPEAFLMKMLMTAATLGAGFKGGEIVPVFFTGATFGCVTAPLLGLPASFGAGLGMVSVFCGVTNCPLSSMLLAVELFGAANRFPVQSLGLFAVSIAVSYMLSGYYGLYSEQKILYSKYRPEFIDRKAE